MQKVLYLTHDYVLHSRSCGCLGNVIRAILQSVMLAITYLEAGSGSEQQRKVLQRAVWVFFQHVFGTVNQVFCEDVCQAFRAVRDRFHSFVTEQELEVCHIRYTNVTVPSTDTVSLTNQFVARIAFLDSEVRHCPPRITLPGSAFNNANDAQPWKDALVKVQVWISNHTDLLKGNNGRGGVVSLPEAGVFLSPPQIHLALRRKRSRQRECDVDRRRSGTSNTRNNSASGLIAGAQRDSGHIPSCGALASAPCGGAKVAWQGGALGDLKVNTRTPGINYATTEPRRLGSAQRVHPFASSTGLMNARPSVTLPPPPLRRGDSKSPYGFPSTAGAGFPTLLSAPGLECDDVMTLGGSGVTATCATRTSASNLDCTGQDSIFQFT